MKKQSIFYTLLLLTCCFACFTCVAQNLLLNPSFEDNGPLISNGGNALIRYGSLPEGVNWERIGNDTLDFNYTCKNGNYSNKPIKKANYFTNLVSADTANYQKLPTDLCYGGTPNTRNVFKPISGKKSLYNIVCYSSVKKSVGISSATYQKLDKPLIKNHNYVFSFYSNSNKFYVLYSGKRTTHYEYINYTPKLELNNYALGLFMQKPYLNLPYEEGVQLYTCKNITYALKNRIAQFNIKEAYHWDFHQCTFYADSNFNYLFLGNLFENAECKVKNLDTTKDLNSIGFAIDSLLLWDITTKIKGNITLCATKKHKLHATYYSTGINTWYNKAGIVVGYGDSIELDITKDTSIVLERNFTQIAVKNYDTVKIEIKLPYFTVKRLVDSCVLPAKLLALPTNYTYTWNGVKDSNYHIHPIAEKITITASDSFGCQSSLNYTLLPPFDFNYTIVSDPCATMQEIRFSPLEFDYFLDSKSVVNPAIIIRKPKYTALAVTKNNCRLVKSISIPNCKLDTVNIFIPNAFSPNENNLNEVFNVAGTHIKSTHLKIYNRWGQLVFDNKNNSLGWNGSYLGKPVNDGVFIYSFYILLVDGSFIAKNGIVHLIK